MSKVIHNSDDGRYNILETDDGRADGMSRCPSCGSTMVGRIPNTNDLVCHHCRRIWTGVVMEQAFALGENISNIRGRVVGSGAQDIATANTLLALSCHGCGAEVVINTATNLSARCHWCRQKLGANSHSVMNGSVPDAILPFSISHEQAVLNIRRFVQGRTFFAKSRFTGNFTPDNVMGVYLPYMVMDGHGHVNLRGYGETELRTWALGKERYYDADGFIVEREFDAVIDDLIIESSSNHGDMTNRFNTNSIINSVLPFDVKNMVQFDSNYMGAFSSEKRDMSIDDGIAQRAFNHMLTVSRQSVNASLPAYAKRGVRWEEEIMEVYGTRWVAVYLPVWIYTYIDNQSSSGKPKVHYIAVNGRTGRTMGSIPLNKSKLNFISWLFPIVPTTLLAVPAMTHMNNAEDALGGLVTLGMSLFVGGIAGGVVHHFKKKKYQNTDERYQVEDVTRVEGYNLRGKDTKVSELRTTTLPFVPGGNMNAPNVRANKARVMESRL